MDDDTRCVLAPPSCVLLPRFRFRDVWGSLLVAFEASIAFTARFRRSTVGSSS